MQHYKAIGSYIGAAPHASFLNCARAFNVSEDGLGKRANNICKRNQSSLLIHTRVQDGVCTQRIIEKSLPVRMYILPTIGWRVDSGPSLDAGWAPHLAPEHIRSIASKRHQGF